MKFAFGIALLAVSTEAALSSFVLPEAAECSTAACNTIATNAATATAEAINVCLWSASNKCTYTAKYFVASQRDLPFCTLPKIFASAASQVYGYDLSILAPLVQGDLTAVTGQVTITLGVSTSRTCTAHYLVHGINTTAKICTSAATTRGMTRDYSTGSTFNIPLTTSLFSARTPIGTNLQVGSVTYENCGESYNSAALSETTYTMTYQGRISTTSGAVAIMALELLPILYFIM